MDVTCKRVLKYLDRRVDKEFEEPYGPLNMLTWSMGHSIYLLLHSKFSGCITW